MNGFEVRRRLRENARCDTPVLMLTARDTLEDKLAGWWIFGQFKQRSIVNGNGCSYNAGPLHERSHAVPLTNKVSKHLGADEVKRRHRRVGLERVNRGGCFGSDKRRHDGACGG